VNSISEVAHTLLVLTICLVVATLLERWRFDSALSTALAFFAAVCTIVLAALVVNHIRDPFQLDLMEGVTMQHARRAMHGQSIYPLPTPEFVPLAYNALFYVIAAPFLRIFGDNLTILRTVSVIGMAGSAVAVFVMVRDFTRSTWWSLIALGLFCAAYPAMDAYLDTAHSDAWLLCCALWGMHLVGRDTRRARMLGVLVLVAAFWFKQHGAVFLGAALAFLTWREGLRGALAYWMLAIVLGPLLYLLAPGTLLGPGFHYFTWQVPTGWSPFRIRAIPRMILHAFVQRVTLYLLTSFPILATAALAGAYRAIKARKTGILEFQLGAAFITALMGSMDSGSSNNVFIPLAAFCIVCGTIQIARWYDTTPAWNGVGLWRVATVLAFATLVHDPRAYWIPAAVRGEYADLLTIIRELPGTVYAPGIGELEYGPELYPGAHWVALDDIMRGSRRTSADSALARSMLDPLRNPSTTAFVLTNRPLATLSPPVRELAGSYSLVKDYGERFALLTALPRRFDHGFPRYLYRFTGAGVPESGH
jgi:4-amino-4-deoxy-L-arabinose transferase-like glycosyltransferase